MKNNRKAIGILILLGAIIVFFITQRNKHQAPPPTPTSSGNEYAPNTKIQSVHVALGVPSDGDESDDFILTKSQYVLSYNKNKNVANWVSWELNASWYGSVERKQGQFMPDPTLPAGFYRVIHKDYTNSGFDRGHLVRSEERTATREDNDATFYCTNLLPQYHDLNAGPWLRLEEYCERLSKKENKELFVIAGGIFRKNPPTIGNGVAVPDTCWKIIAVLERGQTAKDISAKTRVIAVKMPNVTGIASDGWEKYRSTVNAIEQSTGYNFLSNIPNDIQQALENKQDGSGGIF